MNENEMNEIIKRIKDRRTEMGLSYQDMENATGISKSTWQRYETGKIRKLGIDKLDLIAKILKTTPAYLMGWEEKKDIEEFTTPEAAMQFILKQPAIAAYGGFDVNKMSDDEVMEFANELLRQLKLLGYKYNK